jgi:hypothetical protein
MMSNAYWHSMTIEALETHLASAREGLTVWEEALDEWESNGNESPENVRVCKVLVAGLEKRVAELRQSIQSREAQN